MPTSADVDTLSVALWPPQNVAAPTRVILPYGGHESAGPSYYAPNKAAYDIMYSDPTSPELSAWNLDALPPKGTPFIGRKEVGAEKTDIVTKVDIYEWMNFSKTFTKVRANYAVAVVKILDSKPVDLKFKLNENIYKSQASDLADISFDNTINIAGTLSDDTEFSYNALVK